MNKFDIKRVSTFCAQLKYEFLDGKIVKMFFDRFGIERVSTFRAHLKYEL
jgi:hypothetical protein